jgi:hypothetical protein
MWLWNFLLTCSDCFCFLVHPTLYILIWLNNLNCGLYGFHSSLIFLCFFLSFHKLWINLLWLHSEKFLFLSHSAFLFAICSWIFHIISQYNLNKHLISCSFCLSFFVCFRLSSFRWLLLYGYVVPLCLFAIVRLFWWNLWTEYSTKEEIDQNIHSIWIEIEV